MMVKSSKSGFSLVELLAASLATTIMALAIGSLMVYGWTGWFHYNASVDMQRDVSIAMKVIAKEVRRTPMVKITGGASLTCVNTNGTFTFSVSGNDLNMQKDSDAAWALVRGESTPPVFRVTKNTANGSVNVVLNVTLGNDNSNNQMTIFSRN